MMARTYYKREPMYKHVSRNEAAQLQANMASLSIFIHDHPNINKDLMDLFNKKIELMLQLHDLCTEIINFGNKTE